MTPRLPDLCPACKRPDCVWWPMYLATLPVNLGGRDASAPPICKETR